MQARNLLRHVLRDKIGSEAFDRIPELGSKKGAKDMATIFEGLVETHLAREKVSFETEEEQKRKWEHSMATRSSLAPTFSPAAFHLTGIDDSGRRLWQGPCARCSGVCVIPFKPFSRMRHPPSCRQCQTSASWSLHLTSCVLACT